MSLSGYPTSRKKVNARGRQKLKPIPQARHRGADAGEVARCQIVFLCFHNYCHNYKRHLDYTGCCAVRLRYVDLVVCMEVAVEVCCCLTVFSC
jgi:hypothetical protein